MFQQPAPDAARALIGMLLLADGVGGIIVETEAYARDDPASHSFTGPTRRTVAMFGPPGHAYVYRSYGVHWCLNMVTTPPGSAVLVRALEPVAGLDAMQARRGLTDIRLLCRGPGRLCQALGIGAALDGAVLDRPPFVLQRGPAVPLLTGPRIGITRAVDVPWRFGLAGSRFLSRPFPKTLP